jgi:small subunit ribosomal protein S20
MPNIRQQEKRVRTAARERLQNLRYRSTVKTLTKRLRTAVEDGDDAKIAAEHRELVRTIDKPAGRAAQEHRCAPQGAGGPARLERRLEVASRRRPPRARAAA